MKENKAKINIKMEDLDKGVAIEESIEGTPDLLIFGLFSLCEQLLKSGVNINTIHEVVDLAMQEYAESEN